MTPYFSITGGSSGGVVIDSLNDRLLGVRVTDNAGYLNDRLTITIDDRPPYIKVPVRGDKLKVMMGYQQKKNQAAPSDLMPMGTFIIDEIEWDLNPKTLVITGHAADTNGKFKQARSASWHRKKFKEIVESCAQYSGLSIKLDDRLKEIEIEHEDQIAQSCSEFLRVFCDRNKAEMKVQDETIIIGLKGELEKVGDTIIRPSVTIQYEDLSSAHYVSQSRSKYVAVQAQYQTPDKSTTYAPAFITLEQALGRNKGDTSEGTIPPEAIYTIQTIYANAREAYDACFSKMRTLALSECGFGATCVGNPNIVAESNIKFTRLRPGIQLNWRCVRVTHSYSPRQGYTCELECESPMKESSESEEEE